jgi:diguanylate cyclase (GGDEF)-like protein
LRRVGLLGRFGVASLAAFAVLALVLARVESAQIRSRALTDATNAASLLAEVGLGSHLTPQAMTEGLSPDQLASLDQTFESALAGGQVARIKIWAPDGRIVYSDDHSLIGRQFPVPADLREAFDGEGSSDVTALTRAENVGERSFGQLLEVYLPLRFSGGPSVGAFELYVPYAPIATVIAGDTRHLILILLGGLTFLWLVLFRVVLGASRRLRRDAAALRRTSEENEYLAMHDQLTDLPNRTAFHERCVRAIEAADRREAGVAVIVLDLDRFKEVNDALGHECGDSLLTMIGPRLSAALRTSDTVARLGGDEFGILLEGMHAPEEAIAVAQKITDALVTPFEVDEMELEVSASLGIAMFPQDAVDADALLRHADVAMYSAKEANTRFDVYVAEEDRFTADRLRIVGDLRRAIDGDVLSMHFQPKVEVATGRLIGVEALARWDDAERGSIPPDVFIPLAEHTGLIRRLTSKMVESAISQCRRWVDLGLEIPIAVNLSARDLLDEDLPVEIEMLLARYDIPASLLELEITEGSIMDQPALAIGSLDRLSAMGVALAIDDFGTGYSSLGYLQRLPVNTLKIDRSFVLHLCTNENDAVIVRSTVELGHNLGLLVVAEGVEDGETLKRLAEMECDVAQGYHVARPMPALAFEHWIKGYIAEHTELVGGPI